MAMISMLIGILTAFFVYNDAKKRGHGAVTAILWSVGSIVVPYIILPLYLLLGRRNQQRQYNDNDVIDIEATVIEEETMSCTKCGHKIEEDFLVCPYCQQPIDISKKDNNN